MKVLLDLFFTFFRVGLFTFGGGYAMLSVIEDICVERKQWITHDDMMYVTVVAESTPGPVAINLSTFVGYKKAGVVGAIVSTFGIIVPSFAIIYAISMFFDDFLEITVVANAFRGIKLAVGVLIVNAAVNMIKKMKKDRRSIAILAAACVAMLVVSFFSIRISPIIIMIFFGVMNLIWFSVKEFAGKRKGGGV